MNLTKLFPLMPPVIILESDEYELVIRDNMGVTHYWTSYGYDSCSIELKDEDNDD